MKNEHINRMNYANYKGTMTDAKQHSKAMNACFMDASFHQYRLRIH
jgi:hypothetical protein